MGPALRLLIWLLVLQLAGCAALPHDAPSWKPVSSVLDARQRHVVVQQWDLSCGAASLATLMNYQHGESLQEKAIAESMLRRTNPLTVRVKGGFSLLDLKRFVEAHGYQGKGYMKLRFDQLLAFQPAIVPVNLGDYHHFVVFRGAVGDKVLLADPAFGNRTVSRSDFEQGWAANIAFVVRRRDGLAPPSVLGVEPVDFVRVPSAMLRQALH